ncbi:MAG TPA: IPT/TIG domain-containing protein [Pyrinomonadaceae bacterium]|nr:IPT/TIG domain-containing protein [Pyrinomonadaceae bacterium]
MQRIDLSKPGEKKKIIMAAVLGLVAIIVLWWVLIGFDSGTPTVATRPSPTPSPQARATQRDTQRPNQPASVSQELTSLAAFTEVVYTPSSYNPPEARRNIFAYYEPPKKPQVEASVPTPTPTPPPPVLLASVSPSNVYARTADFKLEIAGDKFTPAMRIYIDGREFPTAYKSPQQLSTTVPAAVIANPGVRNVAVRTPDNLLFSNQLPINVAAAPTPDSNFSYIGIISTQNRVGDIALVQERSNRNVINATRGDVIGGRFRVTSISEKELVMVDTSLKIKHTLKMSEGPDRNMGPLSRPTPRVDAEDDEP